MGDCPAHDNMWDGNFLNDEEESGQEESVCEEYDKLEQSARDQESVYHCQNSIEAKRPFRKSRGDISSNCKQISTLEQQQSILFTLPYDIRTQIWTHVAGGGLVHITELRNLLGYVPCTDRRNRKWGMWSHDCWLCTLKMVGQHVAPESYGNPEDRWKRHGSLGLLRSCRRLYAEAINVLYEANTFCFRSIQTMHVFLKSLTLERLDHVASLYLAPMIHENFRDWDHTWRTLADLPSLKRLRVELRGKMNRRPGQGGYFKNEEDSAKGKLLHAMCCIEQTELFEVKVPWELIEIKDWIWACPFVLEGLHGETFETGEKEYLALLRSQRIDIRDWFRPKKALAVESFAEQVGKIIS